MRLLNTDIDMLRLQSFMPDQIPDYAILSHLWGDEEITFEDFTRHGVIDGYATGKRGLSKVKGACKLAARDGYEWIWIDTCCIDKSSSAELQESINAMWNYYANSNICYVYMVDVLDVQANTTAFRKSRWFTRGWTLQELIAPTSVEFYTKDWLAIGTKSQRSREISAITKIHQGILDHVYSVDVYTAAEKMSWAAHRSVTREEDETYSLLGLFSVSMPMLYGEGRRSAFMRLQETIYCATRDDSIFLFSRSLNESSQPLLADSPARFCRNPSSRSSYPGDILAFPRSISYNQLIPAANWYFQAHETIWGTYTPSRTEVTTALVVLEYSHVSAKLTHFKDSPPPPPETTHVAVLNHTLNSHPTGALCLFLFRPLDAVGVAYTRLRSFPALLPCTKEFTAKMQPRRVLICANASLSPKTTYAGSITFLTFQSSLFHVLSWQAKAVSRKQAVTMQENPNAEFQVESSLVEGYEPSAEITAYLDREGVATPRIAVRLAWIGRNWSIREVSAWSNPTPRFTRARPKHTHVLFSSQVLCDCCSVCTDDGVRLLVELRRLAAPKLGSGMKPFRYQVVVRRSEVGDGENEPQ